MSSVTDFFASMKTWLTTSTPKNSTKTLTKKNTTVKKKPPTTAAHNSITELANNPGKFLRDYFEKSRPQTYHFFSIFYNNHRLPHLIAILFFSMLTGWMPFAYTRLFKLHTNVIQDGVSYALFYQASFAVILWGILRVIAENLTIIFRSNYATEISNMCRNNLHKKLSYFYNYNNNKLSKTTDNDTKKKTVINTDSASNISTFYENYSKSIVIKSMKLVNMLSYICYLATDAGRQLLHPLLLPLPIFYVLSRAIIMFLTPEHEKLNKEVTAANQTYQSTFNKWTKNWTNSGLNGRAALRKNNNSKLNVLSNNNTKKQQQQNIAKELLAMIEKNTRKIGDILSFICLIGIYGLPKLQSQSATAGILFGYSVLNQIQVNMKNAINTITDVLCGKAKKNQELDTSYESIKDLQEGLDIELNQQSDLTRSQPILQPTLTDSVLLTSGVSLIINLWALLCFTYFNSSITEILCFAIHPSLATANIIIAASLITLGALRARYHKLFTTHFYNQLTLNFVAHFITLPLVEIVFTSLTSLQPLSVWTKAATHALACIGVNFSISKILHQQLLPPILTLHNKNNTTENTQDSSNISIDQTSNIMITQKNLNQHVTFYSNGTLVRRYNLQSTFKLVRGEIACIIADNSTGKSSLLKAIVQHAESPTPAESGETDVWNNLAIKGIGKDHIGPQYKHKHINLNKHNLMYWKQADNPTELTGEYKTPLLQIMKGGSQLALKPMQMLFLDQVITNNDHQDNINYDNFTVAETDPNHKILKNMRNFIDDVTASAELNLDEIQNLATNCTPKDMRQTYLHVENYIAQVKESDSNISTHMVRWYAYMAILGVPLEKLKDFEIPECTESGGLFSKIWTALQISTLHLDWLQILLLDEPCQQMDHTATPLAKTLLKVVNDNQQKYVLVIDHSIHHEQYQIFDNNNIDITNKCRPLLPSLSRHFCKPATASSENIIIEYQQQSEPVRAILYSITQAAGNDNEQSTILEQLTNLDASHEQGHTTSIDTIYKLQLQPDNISVTISEQKPGANTVGSTPLSIKTDTPTPTVNDTDQLGMLTGSPLNNRHKR